MEARKIPERIFLQWFDGDGEEASHLEDICWCEDRIEKDDPEYLLASTVNARIAALEAEVAQLRSGIHPPVNPMPGGFSLDKFMPSLTPEDAAAMGDALDAMDAEQLSGNPGELDTLRAENATLKAKLEEVEATNDRLRQDRLDYSAATTTEGMNASEWIWRTGKAERERDTAESRATALAARVEALEPFAKIIEEMRPFCNRYGWAKQKYCDMVDALPVFDFSSTPAADLAAHDDRIRRETVERILAAPTGGEKYILQSPSFGQRDILPLWFYRAAGITEPGHAGEEG